ncbi:MAG: biotin transporter BioY [Myxococcota bacterium]
MSPTYRLFRSVMALLAGLGLLVWSAQVPLPFVGPETSLLSFAMVLIALLGGVRLATVTTAVYVGLVYVGRLPWQGLDPSALQLPQEQQLGYLGGLVAGAFLTGLLYRRNSWLGLSFAAFVGHVALFGVGVAVLAQTMGPTFAMVGGAWPYVFGAVVKSVFAALLVAIFRPPFDDP